MWSFQARISWYPKDAEAPDDYEDAFGWDETRAIAAVADGVTEGIFKKQWARLLIESIVRGPCTLAEPALRQHWLCGLRQSWLDQIDVPHIPLYLHPKLREGASATLLYAELLDRNSRVEGSELECPVSVTAIGDCCLLHLRESELLSSFPIKHSSEFGSFPCSVCSVDRNRDQFLEVATWRSHVRDGDWLILCTDAWAAYLLGRIESGQPLAPDWLWNLSPETWASNVESLRTAGDLRYDDTTMLVLQIQCPPMHQGELSGDQFCEE